MFTTPESMGLTCLGPIPAFKVRATASTYFFHISLERIWWKNAFGAYISGKTPFVSMPIKHSIARVMAELCV